MTIPDLAAGVQFTVDANGRTTAVVVTPEIWHRIMEAIESAEDRTLVEALRSRLTDGPVKAGATRWQDVSKDW